MKRKIIGILICLLLCTSVSAVAGIENNEMGKCLEEKIKINSQPIFGQWDIQFAYDVDTPTNEQSLVGCEFDGEHFLVSEWGYSGANQSLVVSKLDRNGSLVSQWFPTWLTGGSGGLRDLAYDGEYFYGSNTDSKIYCFDVDGALITSWSVPAAVRSIAYDEDNDAFWINNWAEDLLLVDRSGSTLYTISTPPSMYGSAWEKEYSGLPFVFALWAVRKEIAHSHPRFVTSMIRLLDMSKQAGISHLDNIALNASRRLGLSPEICRQYFQGLHYDLDSLKIKSLNTFFTELRRYHFISKPVNVSPFHSDTLSLAACPAA